MKYSYNNKAIFVFFVLLLIFMSACNSNHSDSQTKIISGYSFNTSNSKMGFNYLKYEDSQRDISMKILPGVDYAGANSVISDRMTLFESVFEPRRVDYPGAYTKTIICPDEYKPQRSQNESNEERIDYFKGFANSNKVAGACAKDIIKYNYVYGFIYCKNQKELIEIDYYSELNESNPQKFIQELNCGKI